MCLPSWNLNSSTGETINQVKFSVSLDVINAIRKQNEMRKEGDGGEHDIMFSML
jgi:hypothetical protein